MEKRSLAAIDADLVLVQHEIGLAEPHRQQCPDAYAALIRRRQELEQEREREDADGSPRISRLPAAYWSQMVEPSGPLPGEGVKSDAQPIRISGHGGRVVFDEPAKEWVGASATRKQAHEAEPPAGDAEFGPKNPFGLTTPKEREAFFKDLSDPKAAEFKPLKENVYRRCIEHSSAREKFFWGLHKERDKDKIEYIGHEFVLKDFYPKVKALLDEAEKDLAEARKAGDESALKNIALGVASGCRNATEQLILWNQGFITNLYRGAQVSISGPKDGRVLEGGEKFRIDRSVQEQVRVASDGPKFEVESEEAKADGYEIQWQKQAKKGKYIDCELNEATHALVKNAALLRLMKGGLGGQDAANYLAAVVGKKIATPGWSRHQHGIAVDFSPPQVDLKIKFEYVKAWKQTWLFDWLGRGNAKSHDLKNYLPEPWHWEDKSAGT
jgi:hypothetical protein